MTRGAQRWMAIGGGLLVGLAIIELVALAAFPWGSLKGVIERQLTDRFGRTVTIGGIERVDSFGFTPTIRITGVRIPQAAWAGGGDFVALREAEATFSALALLKGGFAPRNVVARGLRLALVRDREGRTNWDRPGTAKSGGSSTDIGALTIADSVVTYADAKQDRRIVARIASDPVHGARARGTGVVRGAAVRLTFSTPSIARSKGKAWPFAVALDGDALAISARGTMDRPLDTDAMTIDVTARSTDLKLIDAVIEAGLFRTQPVSLRAHVRREAPKWTITALKGVIGRSDFSGRLVVDKRDGRSRIDGDIATRRFDFADLSTDAAQAAGAALERRIGPRLIPNTRIDIGKIDSTDGHIDFRIGRIVSEGRPSPILSARGRLAIDRQVLTLDRLFARVPQGNVTGRMTVDQRGDRRVPIVTIDLRLRDAGVQQLNASAGISGAINAHARLTGSGETIRAAIGRGNGRIALVARDGQLPAGIAAALGFDAARALLARDGERAGLRCLILSLDVTGGRGRVAPMIVDTTASQMRGSGSVVFPAETIAIRLTGAPKRGALLRLPGSATLGGTIRQPVLAMPPEIRSAGNVFKAIGRAITGNQGPTASDADCAGLARRVLR